MQQNALIQIKGIQYYDDDSDVVELTTVGSFFRRKDAYYIRYDESEATGFEGSRTTLKVEDNRCITLQRTGEAESQLIIEKGQRHQCLYNTGYGDLVMGVSCDKITTTLDSDGGRLHFKYTLDLNASMASQNEVFIVVKRTAPDTQNGGHRVKGAPKRSNKTGINADNNPDVKTGIKTSNKADVKTGIKMGIKADIKTGNESNIKTRNEADIKTSIKTDDKPKEAAPVQGQPAQGNAKETRGVSRVHPVKKRGKAE